MNKVGSLFDFFRVKKEQLLRDIISSSLTSLFDPVCPSILEITKRWREISFQFKVILTTGEIWFQKKQ